MNYPPDPTRLSFIQWSGASDWRVGAWFSSAGPGAQRSWAPWVPTLRCQEILRENMVWTWLEQLILDQRCIYIYMYIYIYNIYISDMVVLCTWASILQFSLNACWGSPSAWRSGTSATWPTWPHCFSDEANNNMIIKTMGIYIYRSI